MCIKKYLIKSNIVAINRVCGVTRLWRYVFVALRDYIEVKQLK